MIWHTYMIHNKLYYFIKMIYNILHHTIDICYSIYGILYMIYIMSFLWFLWSAALWFLESELFYFSRLLNIILWPYNCSLLQDITYKIKNLDSRTHDHQKVNIGSVFKPMKHDTRQGQRMSLPAHYN